MNPYDTLERCWRATTPSGYAISVEEHRSDLSYIVEFYDADELIGGRCISHCPRSGDLLTVAMLREEVLEDGILAY